MCNTLTKRAEAAKKKAPHIRKEKSKTSLAQYSPEYVQKMIVRAAMQKPRIVLKKQVSAGSRKKGDKRADVRWREDDSREGEHNHGHEAIPNDAHRVVDADARLAHQVEKNVHNVRAQDVVAKDVAEVHSSTL